MGLPAAVAPSISLPARPAAVVVAAVAKLGTDAQRRTVKGTAGAAPLLAERSRSWRDAWDLPPPSKACRFSTDGKDVSAEKRRCLARRGFGQPNPDADCTGEEREVRLSVSRMVQSPAGFCSLVRACVHVTSGFQLGSTAGGVDAKIELVVAAAAQGVTSGEAGGDARSFCCPCDGYARSCTCCSLDVTV